MDVDPTFGDLGPEEGALDPPDHRAPLEIDAAEGGWWHFRGSFEEVSRDAYSGTGSRKESFDLLVTLGAPRSEGDRRWYDVTVEARGEVDEDGRVTPITSSGTDLDRLDALSFDAGSLLGASGGRTITYFEASGAWTGRLLLSRYLDADLSTRYALFAGRIEPFAVATPDRRGSRAGRAYAVVLKDSESGCSVDYELGTVFCDGDSVDRAQALFVDPALGPVAWQWRYQFATPDYSYSAREEGAVVLIDAAPDGARPAPRLWPVSRFGTCDLDRPCEAGLECVTSGAESRCLPAACAVCRSVASGYGLEAICVEAGEQGRECAGESCTLFPAEDSDCAFACTGRCPGEMRCVQGRCE